MGLDGCLKKAMDLSNTIQGGKVVFKNVFMGINGKTHFAIFSFINFRFPGEWGTLFYLTHGKL